MDSTYDFSGLKALVFNGTLTPSPAPSHTEKLIKLSTDIMEKHGVETEVIRLVVQQRRARVQALDEFLGLRAVVAEPNWPRNNQDVSGLNLFVDFWPLIGF